ncbi:hypothetical protein V6N13_042285 [Hibiscus sabdariffa]
MPQPVIEIHDNEHDNDNGHGSDDKTNSDFESDVSDYEVGSDNVDEDVLNEIKFDPIILNIGLKIKFLDTIYFGGLCEASKDLNVVCTMHVNCCIGMDRKLIDFGIKLQDWRTSR